MSHEITKTDGLVLHREKAWHGLGTILENAPTPTEALKIAGLDWDVVPSPLYTVIEGATEADKIRIALDSHVANVRSDTREVLGVVGSGYEHIPNRDLAEFCEALAKEDDKVHIESVGSIRGGRKLWFLLKGESFSVRGNDEVAPYICVSNGHDGTAALRCTPTSVRVVCSNTLHMVIPRFDTEKHRYSTPKGAFVARHTGNVAEKVEEARKALGLYTKALADSREVFDHLGAKDVTSDEVKKFFLECWTRDFGPVVDNPKNRKEEKRRERAMDDFLKFGSIFDAERKLAGTTAWNAANAYTNLLHHRKARGKDDTARADNRVHASLFGTDAERSGKTFALALTI